MSMDKMIPLMLGGIKDTLYMTTVSTLFAYLLGLPLAILLVLTAPSGLKPQKLVYRLLDAVVNIFRSIHICNGTGSFQDFSIRTGT